MSTEHFPIRTYGMQELALCYFTKSTAASASCQLKEWMIHNKNLISALQNAGYRKGKKLLTPLQVKIIVEHLGEP